MVRLHTSPGCVAMQASNVHFLRVEHDPDGPVKRGVELQVAENSRLPFLALHLHVWLLPRERSLAAY